MPSNYTAADTIRVLVSTDNHVGYNERDPVRGDDSWKSFHEVMTLAKDRDVDMVLLAGDLFHENKPSRKSMYQVMRSLRMNCYGDKPCELEMLSDASEQFGGTFNHVNYEDPDINVAIPVFSIHGNHDDPSGEGHLAALDILQMSGLINYYGRTPESDNIEVKPVLLQKGNTKLALYGLSNVRDERLFRTFRDGKVKFFQPSTQKDDWFNLMSVHQNHHAYTDTGYLPEHFLPKFLHLVVWGHEHKCLIEPTKNPDQGFHVMQPGSSVATSLVEGEAETKKVAILTIKGQDFDCETIRLKTVRPFVMKEIALSNFREMRDIAQISDNKPKITRFLEGIVNELIEQATEQWRETQEEAGDTNEDEEVIEPPLPLVRLRVEYTAPEGGNFDIDNPQRFSSRFLGRVANATDVVQFHRKRQTQKQIEARPEMPDADRLEQIRLDSVKVEKLVKEFLTAQSLTILPQNNFSDAVGMFVDKDDKNAMNDFVDDALASQVKQLIGDEEDEDWDEERMAEMMEECKAALEAKFDRGEAKRSKRTISRNPKPDNWDSDVDGPWEDQPASYIGQGEQEGEVEVDDEDDENVSRASTRGRGRGRGRGGRAAGTGTTRKTAASTKKAPAKAGGRGKKKTVEDDEDDEEDVVMIDDDDDDDDESQLFVKPTSKKAPAKKAPTRSNAQTSRASTGKQTQLSWLGSRSSQANGSTANGSGRATASRAPPKRRQEPSEDEISDDDAFEPPPAAAARARTSRR
ncbi:DNA repair exonuclease [Hortaea werneckii]|uniref:Double-strand break repair protein n=1 Tax=Hortaea werneckii TaxID=91943 RepID=A0A3M7J2P4_HORWE|nr:DNA repair exonuclease [Hortaea werneckii]KAI7254547.1 DNA repair exonuclease [Hortaea werneckii]KAI7419658.1 DNA repair exonuclease [Hortaea werneckii]KAI7450351.1 DNA repair exonuclease [Hortaea werneckii]KAI7455632.1 DNA repair exonuclease [Hortaea werneckii]